MAVRCVVILFSLFLAKLDANGNNLRLSYGHTYGHSLELEVAWDNSWNHTADGGNHDAIWIFAKGLTGSGQWQPIYFSPHAPDHTAFGDLELKAVPDSMGVFIHSTQAGTFNVYSTQISLRAEQNLDQYRQVKVYGIEMVYIPNGEFLIGDGESISSLAGLDGNPYLVASEGAIQGELVIANPNDHFEPVPIPENIPQAYPKGYASFYIMKYELSQCQYKDFLNTLTYAQQASRTAIAPSSPKGSFAMVSAQNVPAPSRNGIVIVESGTDGGSPARYGMDGNANGLYNEDSDGFHRAANYLSWADLSAYLCWAGLRPISEFEFEKASRGANQGAIAGEFAWGTPFAVNANSVENDGTPAEGVTEQGDAQSGLANHGNVVAVEGWGLQGPLRTGFAASSTSSRVQAGASYYGVMELSGNVWEMAVMAAGGGEYFVRTYGSGRLTPQGDANIPQWCNPHSAEGVLYRGGGWASTISDPGGWRDLAVSDRFYSHTRPTTRRNTSGGRGGR